MRRDAIGERLVKIRIAGGDLWPQEEVDEGIGFLDVRGILGITRLSSKMERLPWGWHNRS